MDWQIYLRTVLALVFVLALITGAAWAAKHFGFGSGMRGPMRRKRRLAVVEAIPVDNRRRLILVRRDGVEHLLLVGGSSDIIVERGIADITGAITEDNRP
ncbi:MAG TPA: flagellar biosynthetic protein FliO [Patescibacteria group bacterium]|nr:flagellar biosynthetic protein FliO [Patescibacteria group bacterium]